MRHEYPRIRYSAIWKIRRGAEGEKIERNIGALRTFCRNTANSEWKSRMYRRKCQMIRRYRERSGKLRGTTAVYRLYGWILYKAIVPPTILIDTSVASESPLHAVFIKMIINVMELYIYIFLRMYVNGRFVLFLFIQFPVRSPLRSSGSKEVHSFGTTVEKIGRGRGIFRIISAW